MQKQFMSSKNYNNRFACFLQDHEQLRLVAESILASLLVSCSGHTIQTEFLLFALHTLLRLSLLNWDSFLPMLLRSATATESSSPPRHLMQSSSNVVGNNTAVPGSHTSAMVLQQVSTPAPPASPASAIIGSPQYSANDNSTTQSPAKTTDTSSVVALPTKGMPFANGTKPASWLRQVVCKVLSIALDTSDFLHPLTCFEALSHMVQWVHTWDAMGSDSSEETKLYAFIARQHDAMEWLYDCLDIIKALVDETKSRLPFYALLHDHTQIHLDHWPDDAVLFPFFLEVHRRRDKISAYMQMLDHCPTFATIRMVALTYQGAMGEPLHGEVSSI